MPGKALMPATLDTWMMLPLEAMRWGLARLVRIKADLVLRFITLS